MNARPATTNKAPNHAPAAGRCPVRNHNSGRMMTGVVADIVETTPVSPPDKAKSSSVIPMASDRKPESAVRQVTRHVSGLRGRKAATGNIETKLRQQAAVPTRSSEARNGSIPVAITGRTMIDPTACPSAASKPNNKPTIRGLLPSPRDEAGFDGC